MNHPEEDTLRTLATPAGIVTLRASREEYDALKLLTRFDGNGWTVDVTLFISVEDAETQAQAKDKAIDALAALGIKGRLAWT